MPKPKLSKNIDEVCYPFIYEASLRCDYEILTDELCRQVGGILAAMPTEFSGLIEELEALQPKIYHLNGSIRGKCAISEADLDWLRRCYAAHKEATADCLSGFVLPRGESPVPQLNAASSNAKKAIRLMVRLYETEAVEIPDVLHRFCNVLCNYFFILTLVINQSRGLKEIPFVSESYRVRSPKS
ncbi:MAG TPA: ATP--cob(I)alamin adenosyltransferase [Opitutae bacterium]|nr:ATP--cob(I)alamin adenosyltransferase [Opitutae bacterium]